MPRPSLHPLSICLAGALLGSLVAAEGLRSPSQTLDLPENRLERLTAVEPGSEAGRYRFRETSAEGAVLELRLPEGAPAELAQGSTWWVGFSELKRQPPDPRTFVLDPEGPRVLLLEGVGAALFPATPAVGTVLGALRDEDGFPANVGAERLGAVLEILDAPEANLRRLAATEIGLNSQLWSGLSAERLESLGDAFIAAANEPYIRFRLLEAARGASEAGLAGAFRAASDWAREALEAADLEADGASYDPALQILALGTLANQGASRDAPSVLRLLQSSHPAVGREAVWTLRSLAPDLLVESAPALLASESLNPETRRVLEAVLRRLSEPAAGDGRRCQEGRFEAT
jgi:hypothetical protein